MGLTTGTPLGPYEIQIPRGAGGMGACGPTELRSSEGERVGVGPTSRDRRTQTTLRRDCAEAATCRDVAGNGE